MAPKKAINRPIYKNADEFRAACETYFQGLSDDEPPTTSGLTLALGFSSHRRFYEQTERKGGDAFAEVLDWCKEKIAHWHEKQVAGTASYSLGWLRKNRPDEWGDQPDVSVESGQVSITINKVYG